MRKGYRSEYLAKKMLSLNRDPESVSKVAIGSFGADFIIFSDNSPEVMKVVEIKECKAKKYYPSKREKEQFKRIKNWCKKRNIRFEIWIHYPKKRKWNFNVIK